MSIVKYVIILSVALSNYIFAQDFQLGFRVEANLLQKHSGNYTDLSEFGPYALQLNAAYCLSNSLALEARLGAELNPDNEDYSGWEYGLMAKYFIGQKAEKAFLIGGALVHTNSGGQYTSNKPFFLPALGIGINISGAFMLETLFLYGMNQKMGESHGWYDQTKQVTVMDWVLKIGAGFSWTL